MLFLTAENVINFTAASFVIEKVIFKPGVWINGSIADSDALRGC